MIEPFKTLDAGLSYFIQGASDAIETKAERAGQCEALLKEIEVVDLSIWNEDALDEFRDRVVRLVSHLVEGISIDANYLKSVSNSLATMQTDLRNFFDSLDSRS